MFITFEGIEGSGKTTQVGPVVDFFRQRDVECVVTREPGGTRIGEKIRAILMDPENNGLFPMTELMLYAADRVQHVQEQIAPALAAGKTVVCDRFHDSTVVYQGFSRKIDIAAIDRVHALILDGLTPDLTFLLDLPAAVGLARAWKQINNGQRSGAETRFESENLAFHEAVRAGYLELARREPHRFVIIDAMAEADKVTAQILSELGRRCAAL
jgi:dTMP kinase